MVARTSESASCAAVVPLDFLGELVALLPEALGAGLRVVADPIRERRLQGAAHAGEAVHVLDLDLRVARGHQAARG